ncbi:hypothetical protein [Mycobacterium adipatum]|jgi:hypothetical protein|uniref:hypothetical protein n=1 Tax=Mycobacterium adipatum TaxID=1682113 RepID=UPI000A5DFE56|nr:hypothetical protein [Mycobacterium adipatum]MBI5738381.1 hypothetical protein [Mycolicibacterium neoaurum]
MDSDVAEGREAVQLGWTNTIDKETSRVHWHPPPLMNTGGDTLNHHFHRRRTLPTTSRR